MRVRISKLCAALLAAWWSGPVAAQEMRWEAVGQLEIAGEGFCTGTLISEDLVLTAAHCLFDPQTGARLPETRIAFRSGWRNAYGAAHRTVRAALIHPGYVYHNDANAERVRHDLALLTLVRPIRANQVVPLRAAALPEVGGSVGVVAYAHGAADASAKRQTCNITAVETGVLVLECAVQFGTSGAPVVVMGADSPRVVGVVSAKAHANGAEVALGTGLETLISALRTR